MHKHYKPITIEKIKSCDNSTHHEEHVFSNYLLSPKLRVFSLIEPWDESNNFKKSENSGKKMARHVPHLVCNFIIWRKFLEKQDILTQYIVPYELLITVKILKSQEYLVYIGNVVNTGCLHWLNSDWYLIILRTRKYCYENVKKCTSFGMKFDNISKNSGNKEGAHVILYTVIILIAFLIVKHKVNFVCNGNVFKFSLMLSHLLQRKHVY